VNFDADTTTLYIYILCTMLKPIEFIFIFITMETIGRRRTRYRPVALLTWRDSSFYVFDFHVSFNSRFECLRHRNSQATSTRWLYNIIIVIIIIIIDDLMRRLKKNENEQNSNVHITRYTIIMLNAIRTAGRVPRRHKRREEYCIIRRNIWKTDTRERSSIHSLL